MHGTMRSVSIARYGEYGTLTYERGPHAGRAIEYVDVLEASDDGTVSVRRMTLDPAINGDRPAVGSLCDVDVLVRLAPEVVYRRDGGERITQRDKWRATGFTVLDGPLPVADVDPVPPF